MPVKIITSPKSKFSEMNPIKLRLIQQELILLFHAMRCKGCKCRNWSKYCVLPLCKTYKEVMEHISVCQVDKCQVPKCSSSKIILSHWMSCSGSECTICNVVLKTPEVKKFGYDNLSFPVQHEKEEIK